MEHKKPEPLSANSIYHTNSVHVDDSAAQELLRENKMGVCGIDDLWPELLHLLYESRVVFSLYVHINGHTAVYPLVRGRTLVEMCKKRGHNVSDADTINAAYAFTRRAGAKHVWGDITTIPRG